MAKRNHNVLDNLGNYLCTLGCSHTKIEFLAIPAVIFVMLIIVFSMIASALSDMAQALALSLNLTENMSEYIELTLSCINWSWMIGGAIMLWERHRGAVNAVQTATHAVFYLTIVLTVVSKLMSDIKAERIQTDGLNLVFYIVSFVAVLIVFCLVAIVSTLVGAPIYLTIATMIGIAIDLALGYFLRNKFQNTSFFNALTTITKEIDLRTQISEVQVIDAGVYFVNPAAKVVRRIHFSQYNAADLNVFTRKIFLAQLMRLLPSGYRVDALANMWVANNKQLLKRLNQADAKSQSK